MAFSPPEYCRLFAQKKAYQGGVMGNPGPPLATPCMVTTGNTRPVIVFVNIEQNLFPVLLCAWNLATREKIVFEPFHSQKWLPFEHWFLCWTKLPKWITNNHTQYHTYFWKYWKFKKKTIVSVKKILEKWYIYYCVKVYYKLVISGLSYLFIWIVIFNLISSLLFYSLQLFSYSSAWSFTVLVSTPALPRNTVALQVDFLTLELVKLLGDMC